MHLTIIRAYLLVLLVASPCQLQDVTASNDHVRNIGKRASGANNVFIFRDQVGSLARFANALYIEAVILNDHPIDEKILTAELTNVGDTTVINKLLALKPQEIYHNLKMFKYLPDVLPDDRESILNGLEAVVRLTHLFSNLTQLVEMKDLEPYANEIGWLTNFDFSPFASDSSVKALSALESIKKLPDNVTDMFKHAAVVELGKTALDDIEAFEKYASEIQPVSNDLASHTQIADGPAIMKSVVEHVNFLDTLTKELPGLNSLANSLASLSKKEVEDLQQTVKQSEDFESLSNFMDALQDVLISTEKHYGSAVSRRETPSFPRGVISLNENFDSVKSKWIWETMEAKRGEAFKFHMKPLERVSNEMADVEGRLRQIAAWAESLSIIETMSNTLKSLMVVKKSKTSLQDALKDVQTKLKSQPRFNSVKKAKRINEIFEFCVQLKNANDESNLSKVKDALKPLQSMPQFADAEREVAKLKGDKNIEAVISNMRTVQKEVEEVRMIARTIQSIASRLVTFKDELANLRRDVSLAAVSTSHFFKSIGIASESFDILSKAYKFATSIKAFHASPVYFHQVQSLIDDVSQCSIKISALLRMMSDMAENKLLRGNAQALEVFKESAGVALKLANGEKLAGFVADAILLKEELKTISTHAEDIDREIGALSNSKIRDEVRIGWPNAAQVKNSLGTLYHDLTTLEKEIPETGATDIPSTGTLLSKLKIVKNPGIDLAAVRKSINLLHISSSSQLVAKVRNVLEKCSSLHLDFVSAQSQLDGIADSVNSFNAKLTALLISNAEVVVAEKLPSATLPISNPIFFHKNKVAFWVTFCILLVAQSALHAFMYFRERKTIKSEINAETGKRPIINQVIIPEDKKPDEEEEEEKNTPVKHEVSKEKKALRTQRKVTRQDLQKLQDYIKRRKAEHKSETNTKKFVKRGPIYIPMNPDIPPPQPQAENITLDHVEYFPQGNEMFDVGSDVDDIEIDSSTIGEPSTIGGTTSEDHPPPKEEDHKPEQGYKS
ncbi:unnamed protein product [Caenorhabditis sp. 36 PRJEB53466]|nr:unnamed protein product [Caenorhabditis sp. 36 PRJEB53466]